MTDRLAVNPCHRKSVFGLRCFVLTQDENTGETSLREVIDTFMRRGAPIVAVTISSISGASETLRTTEEHPFYVADQGWTTVDQLEPGDPIRRPLR